MLLGARADHWIESGVRLPCMRCGRTSRTLPWGVDESDQLRESWWLDALTPPVCPACSPAWPLIDPPTLTRQIPGQLDIYGRVSP